MGAPTGEFSQPAAGWDRFHSKEIAKVLSHFDLGVIATIREYHRGSRRAPKLRIRSDRGEFLLKRRSTERDSAERVRFCQSIQKHVASCGVSTAELIPTRGNADTLMKRTVKTENRTLIGTSVDVQSTSLTQTQEHAADTIAKKSSHFSDAPPMSPPSTSSQAKSSAAFFAFTDPP